MTPGQRFGDLVVEARLGAGGMGVVYRVHHQATGATYALKVLSAAADLEEARRFAREGEALAAVDDHPNVVRIHAAGEVEGRRYLLMQLCAGGDLKARLRAGGLPVDEAARVVLDVARGIAHVHAHGIVHRDLKPENVLFDDDGRTRVTDFGLARVAGAESLTATGTLLGTPAYMAPEQADGGAIDARTDVWALGGLLIAALTGRAPYQGTTPINVIAKLLNDDPRWPSADRPDTPPALEAIVRRAMARDPADRYQDAAAVADDLERFLRGGPDAGPGDRPRALALGAALIVLLGGVVAWILRRPPPAEFTSGPSRSAAETAVTSSASNTDATVEGAAPAPTWRRLPQGTPRVIDTAPRPAWLTFVNADRLLVGCVDCAMTYDLRTGEHESLLAGCLVAEVPRGGAKLFVPWSRSAEAGFVELGADLRPVDEGRGFQTQALLDHTALSASGALMVAGELAGGRVHVLAPPERAGAIDLPRGGRFRVAVAPDGSAFACGMGPEVLLLRHDGSHWARTPIPLDSDSRALRFVSPDLLLVGTTGGVLVQVDVRNGAQSAFVADPSAVVRRAHGLPVRGVGLYRDVVLSVASAERDDGRPSELAAWDAGSRQRLWALERRRRPLLAVAVSPDGQRLALSYGAFLPPGKDGDDAPGRVEVWEHAD